MRIPCGDGVISRGRKANQGGKSGERRGRGKKGKERRHTVMKRDEKKTEKTKKDDFAFAFKRTMSGWSLWGKTTHCTDLLLFLLLQAVVK